MDLSGRFTGFRKVVLPDPVPQQEWSDGGAPAPSTDPEEPGPADHSRRTSLYPSLDDHHHGSLNIFQRSSLYPIVEERSSERRSLLGDETASDHAGDGVGGTAEGGRRGPALEDHDGQHQHPSPQNAPEEEEAQPELFDVFLRAFWQDSRKVGHHIVSNPHYILNPAEENGLLLSAQKREAIQKQVAQMRLDETAVEESPSLRALDEMAVEESPVVELWAGTVVEMVAKE